MINPNGASIARGAFHNATQQILMEINRRQKEEPNVNPKVIENYVLNTLGASLGQQLQMLLYSLGAPLDTKVYPSRPL